MAYNQEWAEKIRKELAPLGDRISEKKMFGGLSFMCHGKMCIGVLKDQITVRVLEEKMEGVLSQHGVTPMNFTGKPMKEFVFVDPEVITTNKILNEWIDLGIEHARRASGQ